MLDDFVLILGGSKEQFPIIRKLHDKGIKIILVDKDNNCFSKSYATIFLNISVNNIDEIITKIYDYKIIAVLTYISEATIIPCYKICKKLNLYNFQSYYSVMASYNKVFMRKLLQEKKINDVDFIIPKTSDELKLFQNKNDKIVIKSSLTGGQNGLFFIDNQKKVSESFNLSKLDSLNGEIIAEEYIKGEELNCVLIVIESNIVDLIISDRVCDEKSFGIVKKHSYPSKYSDKFYDEIKLKCKSIIGALDIKNGIIFPQFIISLEKKIHLLELGSRVPGGVMDKLFEYATGIDLMEFYIDLSLGKLKEYTYYIKNNKCKFVQVIFLTAEPGPLKKGYVRLFKNDSEINFNDIKYLNDFYTQNNVKINKLRKGKDRFYFILTAGNNQYNVKTKCLDIYQKLDFISKSKNSLKKQDFNFLKYYELY